MIGVGFAVVSAAVWGAADFCGGKAAQRIGALTTTVASQVLTLPILLVGILLVPGQPRAGDLAWGLAAGAAELVGIVTLYRGLASGAMTSVAPIAAVTTAAVPMVVGLTTDRVPGARALAGAVCAIVAVALISMSPKAGGTPKPTVSRLKLAGLALFAGTMFGIYFIFMAQTTPDSAMWPLVTLRIASISLGVLVMARFRSWWRPARSNTFWVIGAGIGDTLANMFYLVAAREGPLSIVAPVASLAPALTVVLALAIERERIRPAQASGICLAMAALLLITT